MRGESDKFEAHDDDSDAVDTQGRVTVAEGLFLDNILLSYHQIMLDVIRIGR